MEERIFEIASHSHAGRPLAEKTVNDLANKIAAPITAVCKVVAPCNGVVHAVLECDNFVPKQAENHRRCAEKRNHFNLA
jgi:hypothetical protein